MQPRPGLKGNKVFSIIKVKFLIRWAKYRFANKFKQFSTCVNKSHFSQWLIEFTNTCY
uniref:Bm14125, isoform b n=1 Tax=Brugia malayi TaxID=6279 RepID=A0A0J9XM98_BRUMA|nr:Bm14125, isoform b [Brugia malayi]